MRASHSSGTRISTGVSGGSLGNPAMGRCATTSTVWSGHGRDPRISPLGLTAPCPSSAGVRPPMTNGRRETIGTSARSANQGHGVPSRVGEYRPGPPHAASQVTSHSISAPASAASSLTAPPATSTPRSTIHPGTTGSGDRCLTPPSYSSNYAMSGSGAAWRTPPQRNQESPNLGARSSCDPFETKLGPGSSNYTPPARNFRSLVAPTPPALPQSSSPAGPAPMLQMATDGDHRQKRSLTPPMAGIGAKRDVCAGYSPGREPGARRDVGLNHGSAHGLGGGGRSGMPIQTSRGGAPAGRNGGRGGTPRGTATPRALTPPSTQQASRAQAKVTPARGGARNSRWGRGRRADETEAASSKEPAPNGEAVLDETASNYSRQLPSLDPRGSSPGAIAREAAAARRGPLTERHSLPERQSERTEHTVSAIPPSKVCKLEKENRALEREVGELRQKHEKEVGELKLKLQEMEKAFEQIRESTTGSSKVDDFGDQAPRPATPPLASGDSTVNLCVPFEPVEAYFDAKANLGVPAAQGSQEVRRPVSQPPPRSSPPAFSARSKEAAPARSASQQPSTTTARASALASEMPPSPQTKPPPGTWSSGEFERGLAKTAGPGEVFEIVKNVVVDMIQGSSCCTPPCTSLGPPACGTPRNSLGEVRIDQIASPQRRSPRGTTSKAPSRQTPRGTPRGVLAAPNKVLQATRVPIANQESSMGVLRESPKGVIMQRMGQTASSGSNPQGGDSNFFKSRSKAELHDALNSSVVERESCNVHDGWIEPEDNVLDDLSKILQADTPETKANLCNSLDESLMGNSVDESFHGRDFGVPDLPQPKLGDINPANGMRPVLRAVPVGSCMPQVSCVPLGSNSVDLGTPPRGTVFFPAPPTNPSARVFHKGHHQSWTQRSRSNSNNRPS